MSAPRPFSVDDPVRDGFPLRSGNRQIVKGEIVSQLMGQKSTVIVRDQDSVRMRDVERDGGAILRFS